MLIRRIEIRYFRSVYSVSLNDVGALNVFSGRNDAGKSNVLKALNLFFNNSTDWQQPFRFSRDFSLQRLEKVREESVKGKQYVSITVHFNRPNTYSGSLPPTFSVKRTWLRNSTQYAETNDLDRQHRRDNLPASLESARRSLSMLLNRTYYEYVPAIKDRQYFQHLLARLQAALLGRRIKSDSDVGKIATSLAEHIEGHVGALQTDFERATGLTTSIVPPTDLGSLFQSFEVSTQAGKSTVPLVMRGDGVQARYVASVLHYISKNSNENFIWGFEEPENSLEYPYAISLANDFMDIYSKDAQIFLTTHSPAFISLSGKPARRFRVYRDGESSRASLVLDQAEFSFGGHSSLSEDLGVFTINEEIHRLYQKLATEHRTLNTEVQAVLSEMRLLKKPVVLVEGRHDQKIISVAWQKRRGSAECPFILRVADSLSNTDSGGDGGAQGVAKMIEALHPEEDRKAVGVFDNDGVGRKFFTKLSRNFELIVESSTIKRHTNRLAHAITLPVPAFRQEGFVCVEMLFDDEVLQKKTKSGKGLVLALVRPKASVNGVELAIDHLQDAIKLKTPCYQIKDGKAEFAREIVPTLPSDAFVEFDKLFRMIEECLN